MTWRGEHPRIHRVNQYYEKGVKLTKKELEPYQKYIVRSNELPKWDVEIKIR
jgi:ribosome modulation factor